MASLLEVRELKVEFRTSAGIVRAVDGVSFDLAKHRTLAVVGESGSGKSVTALTLLGLAQRSRGHVTGGSARFDGQELLTASEPKLREIRGRRIAMIFQEPMTSLNPVYTVGDQIGEALQLHLGLEGEAKDKEVLRLLKLVGIPAPEQRTREYPHQLSGGMRQRVMIAMALSCKPDLLIADEPTTALDVTIQAQILELMRDLQAQLGMAILLITHDLGVVANMAHDVVVMYAGKVVESASVIDLFERPSHPYTAGLLRSLPNYDDKATRLLPIEGSVPDALSFPSGCRFHPRCSHRIPRCSEEQPLPHEHGPSHTAACFVTEASPNLDLLRGPTA